MATKSFKELKNMTKDELATKLRELEHGLFQARMKHVTGQLADTAEIWRLRKGLARVKMLQGQGKPRRGQKAAAQKAAR